MLSDVDLLVGKLKLVVISVLIFFSCSGDGEGFKTAAAEGKRKSLLFCLSTAVAMTLEVRD
jgi:hypothetical protein